MTTPTFEVTTDGADTYATLAGETTTVVSSLNTTEQTFGTGKMTLTAKKARGRYQISGELSEDSAVAIMPVARRYIVRSIARSHDRAIINGDDTSGSHIDTGYTVASIDFRKAWDGLRYHLITNVDGGTIGTNVAVDAGTYNLDKLTEAQANMGKYGQYPNQLVLLSSIKGYLLRLRSLDEVITVDKYGPSATVLTGELAKVNGLPIVVTEFLEETQNATGIYDGGGVQNRTTQLIVNREMWKRGLRRDIDVRVIPNALDDVWDIVAYKRIAFAPSLTPSSSEVIVSGLYNVQV
jgi:hypothetical protein